MHFIEEKAKKVTQSVFLLPTHRTETIARHRGSISQRGTEQDQ